MRTRIPLTQWKRFCEQFGGQHRGWLVTISVLSPELASQVDDVLEAPGAEIVARDVSLQELRLGEERGLLILRIEAGEGKLRITHQVASPERLELVQTDEGAHRGLRIDSAAGTTVLRFRSAVAPESVDGLLW